MWNCTEVNATRPHWWLVNISSGNDSVQPGNKPLPEPILTKFNRASWWTNTKEWTQGRLRLLTIVMVTDPIMLLRMTLLLYKGIYLFGSTHLDHTLTGKLWGVFYNPLQAKFFSGNKKHIFTFYVIPPYWYDTRSWNPSSSKRRTYQLSISWLLMFWRHKEPGHQQSWCYIN